MFGKVTLAFLVVLAVIGVQVTDAASKHCTWHGTAPMCNLASCPSDKRVIKESNCGNNKIACCVTGKKKLCCPISMGDISPAMAEAIAQ